MPVFRYTLASGGGATIDAPDRVSAIRELARRGDTPVAIEPVGGSAMAPAAKATWSDGVSGVSESQGSGWSMGGGLSRAELAMLIRELATAISAGLPMVQSLKTIARQGRNVRQKAMLNRVIERVEQGKNLADACAVESSSFNDLSVSLMRAGDASGKLDQVLTQAAELLDRDVKLRRSVLAATLYPMILAGLISLAIVVIVTVIVPRVLKSVGGASGKPLPFPTRVVQGAAEFFGGYWWIIIPGIVIGVFYIASLFKKPAFRLWFDTMILNVPLLGRVMRDVAVSRFTRTLGTLVNAGLPAVSALRVTKGTLGNKAMERVIDEVCDQVSSGATLADPMEKSGYFPPMLIQIINLGERSGRLDQLLTQAAGALEDRTETSVKLFMTALPPLLVVALAGVVGFVVLAILLPLLQMQENIG